MFGEPPPDAPYVLAGHPLQQPFHSFVSSQVDNATSLLPVNFARVLSCLRQSLSMTDPDTYGHAGPLENFRLYCARKVAERFSDPS